MSNEASILKQAALEAGAAILKLQETGFSVSRKENNDLLTQADLLANDIIKKHLSAAFPEDGWLSEESVDDEARLQARRVWVVDPIDGTREYALGVPEYAISVALVEEGKPTVACVFNPASNEYFHAEVGKGAWLWDERIHCSGAAPQKLTLLASRSETKRGEWDRFAKIHEVQVVGSIAYKLALIAAGRADATFSLGPKSEWDIAAGVLLVQEAGGVVTDQAQLAFIFNQAKVLVNGIVASSQSAHDNVFRLIEAKVA